MTTQTKAKSKVKTKTQTARETVELKFKKAGVLNLTEGLNLVYNYIAKNPPQYNPPARSVAENLCFFTTGERDVNAIGISWLVFVWEDNNIVVRAAYILYEDLYEAYHPIENNDLLQQRNDLIRSAECARSFCRHVENGGGLIIPNSYCFRYIHDEAEMSVLYNVCDYLNRPGNGEWKLILETPKKRIRTTNITVHKVSLNRFSTIQMASKTCIKPNEVLLDVVAL